MLQKIRHWAHGWFAWTVMLLIAGVFVFWGMSGYLDAIGSRKDVALQVGDETFSQAQLDELYQNMLNQYVQSLKAQGLDAAQIDQKEVQSLMQKQIIIEAALRDFSNKNGLIIGPNQAQAFIQSIPQFQQEGVFSPEIYQSFLQSRNQRPDQFLKDVQNGMLFNQLSTMVGGSALLLPYQIESAIDLIYQTRDIQYAILDVKNYSDQIKIGDEDLQAYYNGHQSEFTQPEHAKVAYILVDRAAIEKKLQETVPSDADLQALYQKNADAFKLPEMRRISHILITMPENASDEERASAKAKIEAILSRLQKGEDFAVVAKEVSMDPGSAGQGGDLGLMAEGSLDPDFEKAAFAASEGQVIGPVETGFGYHLIKVTAIEPAHQEAFDAVKTELADAWRAEQIDVLYEAEVKKLSELASQAATPLNAESAEKMGLLLHEMDVYRDVKLNQPIGQSPVVLEAAFDAYANKQGFTSELLTLDNGDALVLQTRSIVPAALQAFDKVKDAIYKAAFNRQALRLIEQKAQAIEEGLAAGENPAELAKEHGVEWQSKKAVGRRDFELPFELLTAVFKTPAANLPARVQVEMLPYRVAVLQIDAVYPGKLPDFKNEQEANGFMDNLKSQLADFMARRDFDLFANDVKSGVKVESASEKSE